MPTVVLTGSSGLVGRALTESLVIDGWDVIRLVRHPPRETKNSEDAAGRITECQWSTTDGVLEPEKLEGATAVVNLAGESIASGRWTKPRRRRIRESRTLGTRNLVGSLTRLMKPPKTLLNASAIGYYGDRGDLPLTEAARPGTGFLSDVCVDWEQQTTPAADAGIRVVLLRFSMILARHGGALKTMLPPFRLGLGGRLGSGEQTLSWITLEDAVSSIRHCLDHTALTGPVNVVAPGAVTNRQFTRALGRALGRPTLIPVPAAALRLGLGQMADELLLASTHAVPEKLSETGFQFQCNDIDAAFSHIFAR